VRSPFPLYMFIGEFNNDNSDTTVDPVSNKAISALTAQPLSGALDHDVIRAKGQSNAVIKLICIRL
jgi:hypothetical protein